jgi:hypothetical protein
MRGPRYLSDMDHGDSVPRVLGHCGASFFEDAVVFVGDQR